MSQHTVSHTAVVEGHQVDIAPLETIDFARLATKEPTEVAKLLKSSQTPGFFYLDLQNDATRKILTDLQNVLSVTDKYFVQPHELKMKDYRVSQDRGYKPGEDESFEIARDEMVQNALVLPNILNDHVELLERFMSLSHYVTHTMLNALSDALKLDDDVRFEKSHREGEPSNTGLKLVYEPTQADLASVVENKHTDSGTLTLLFGEQWGLQVELPETKSWAFVEPRAGHAVINVADSLQSLSGKRLHSCLHRVTQPVAGFQKRFYIVYFLRPETAIKFENTD